MNQQIDDFEMDMPPQPNLLQAQQMQQANQAQQQLVSTVPLAA